MKTKFKNFIAILNSTALHRRSSCIVQKTNFIEEVVKQLIKRGYLRSYSKISEHKINLNLRLSGDGLPALRSIKFTGRSGLKPTNYTWKQLGQLRKTGGDYLFSLSQKGGLVWLDDLYTAKLGGTPVFVAR